MKKNNNLQRSSNKAFRILTVRPVPSFNLYTIIMAARKVRTEIKAMKGKQNSDWTYRILYMFHLLTTFFTFH